MTQRARPDLSDILWADTTCPDNVDLMPTASEVQSSCGCDRRTSRTDSSPEESSTFLLMARRAQLDPAISLPAFGVMASPAQGSACLLRTEQRRPSFNKEPESTQWRQMPSASEVQSSRGCHRRVSRPVSLPKGALQGQTTSSQCLRSTVLPLLHI
ncbi:uncharacterized protein LOC144134910 [Amblyomma americanum]